MEALSQVSILPERGDDDVAFGFLLGCGVEQVEGLELGEEGLVLVIFDHAHLQVGAACEVDDAIAVGLR